jgi:hypothetical protein
MVFIFRYVSSNTSLTSETYHYKKGSGQTFCQPSHTFNPSILAEDQLSYNMEREICPVAIHCVAEEPTDGNFTPQIFISESLTKLTPFQSLDSRIRPLLSSTGIRTEHSGCEH